MKILKKDKLLHIAVCAGVSLLSWQIALGLAIGKEYGDSKSHGNIWSWGDIIADGIGILIGVSVRYITLTIW